MSSGVWSCTKSSDGIADDNIAAEHEQTEGRDRISFSSALIAANCSIMVADKKT